MISQHIQASNLCANKVFVEEELETNDFLSDKRPERKLALNAVGQINASGYNALLRVSKELEAHSWGVGLSYNISDGYLNRPVLGPQFQYAYTFKKTSRVDLRAALEYQLQFITKGIRTSMLHIKPAIYVPCSNKWGVGIEVGYGLMNESNSKSQETIRQFSNSFLLGIICGYTFTY